LSGSFYLKTRAPASKRDAIRISVSAIL